VISIWIYAGVNNTVGHTTCSVYALKSHILQTRLIGHTTCQICALEVTNRSVVWFFVKNPSCAGHVRSVGLFFAFNPWPKIMWYNFILLIFFRVNCKKKVQIKIFFLKSAFLPRAPEFPVTKQSRKSHELIGRDYSKKLKIDFFFT
jgi:hypothetical protein